MNEIIHHGLHYAKNFYFKDTTTTEFYTLSLHDALPISRAAARLETRSATCFSAPCSLGPSARSEEHTSELQSRGHLVCRLLLEKKKNTTNNHPLNVLDSCIHLTA